MAKTYCCCIVFLLCSHMLAAQPKCKIEHYTTEDGLSHGSITCMLKDKEGFMWFGSWDGINRFDGHAFVAYKSMPGDSSQLGNDRIDQMMEDDVNHLWLKAYDRRIYWFDKASAQFFSLHPMLPQPGNQPSTFKRILSTVGGYVWLESDKDGLYCVPQQQPSKENIIRYHTQQAAAFRLPANTITFFREDSEHRLWIGTPAGMCCLTRTAAGTYTIDAKRSAIAGNLPVTASARDTGHLYVGTTTGNIITIETRTGLHSTRTVAGTGIRNLMHSRTGPVLYATTEASELVIMVPGNPSLQTIRYPDAGTLYSMQEDRTGCVWIEPALQGVIRFDPVTQQSRSYSGRHNLQHDFGNNRFWLFEDNNGLVWIKMKGEGLGYYHAQSGRMEYDTDVPELPNYQFPLMVYSLYYDKTGVIWLSTDEGGMERVVLPGNHFKQQLFETQPLTKNDNEVRGLLTDRKGRLWASAKSGALHIYKDRQRMLNVWAGRQQVVLPGAVYSMAEDKDGVIWMGTKGLGIYKAVPVNDQYKLEHITPAQVAGYGMQGKDIYSLLPDAKGGMWIGSFDKGLWRMQQEGNGLRFQPAHQLFPAWPANRFQRIRHMAQDSAGRLWVGTTDGLMVLDTATGQQAAYSKQPGVVQSLGNNDIQFVYRDNKSRMWLASSGGGMALANGSQPLQQLTFTHYTAKEGMPNDYVLSCVQDQQGYIWMATGSGLSKFDPEKGTFRNYDSYDGMPKANFAEASCVLLPNGQIVFGTMKGLLSFDPAGINANRIAANIAFTSLQVNGEEAGTGDQRGIIPVNINYQPALRLAYNQSTISVGFALLDQRAGNKQVFAYRLKGLDSTWYEERLLRRVTYTNLPPGSYVLEVKSLNSDLYTNTPIRHLAITILPPPWKTWWAYALYILAAIVLISIVLKATLTMLRLRHKIAVEKQLSELKMHFFTNVSHELRTPLTLMINPLEELAKKEKLSPDSQWLLNIVRRNANRMVRFVNQLLDLRKLQAGQAQLHAGPVEVNALVKRTADYFTEAARSKQVTLAIDTTPEELSVQADAEKLDVVIYNLLGNAIKFSPENSVVRLVVQVHPVQQSWSVQVIDEGPGVSKDQLPHIFDLFYEGNTTTHKALKGTGIGLSLSKELVELHGGKIWATNNAGKGLTITVQLPVSQPQVDQLVQPQRITTVTTVQPKANTAQQTSTPLQQGDASDRDLQAASREVANGTSLQEGSVVSAVSSDKPLLLLVEDNTELRQFLERQLGERYRVAAARDGEEGWHKAQELLPDLIVSDIMMPVMDGIQMLDKLKNDLTTSHIPVVLLSARYSVESRIEGLQYGADCYITKPFNNEYLLATIDNLLRQRRKLFESLSNRQGNKLNTGNEPDANSQMPVNNRQEAEADHADNGPHNDLASPVTTAPVVQSPLITAKDEQFLKEVIRFVDDKMGEPDFNIDSIAGQLHMSRAAFYKKFKSLTGLAPIEFVRDRRLQLARQLLDAAQLTIAEVAYQTGFSNPKYFSTSFREKFGQSPSDYQKMSASRQV